MNTLQCVIKCKGEKEEVKKTAEVAGRGKEYLSSLSSSLSQMQTEVNTFLTQLVEKEKAEKVGGVPKESGTSSGDEGCAVVSYTASGYF